MISSFTVSNIAVIVGRMRIASGRSKVPIGRWWTQAFDQAHRVVAKIAEQAYSHRPRQFGG